MIETDPSDYKEYVTQVTNYLKFSIKMIKSPTQNIILIGMMVAENQLQEKIAEKTHLTYLDTDELISASHKKSVQDIFDFYGKSNLESWNMKWQKIYQKKIM